MVTLRIATPTDAEALSALATRTFKETYVSFTPDDLETYTKTAYALDTTRAELSDPTRTTLLAFPDDDDATPCGYITLSDGSVRPGDSTDWEPHDDYLEVKRLYVDKAHHRVGIASALMTRALEIAAGKNRSNVWLGVWQQNTRAHRFYEKHGFQVTGTRTFKVGAEVHNDFVYTWTPVAAMA